MPLVFLDYPLINKHDKIILDKDSEEMIKKAMTNVKTIINGPVPSPKMKIYCKSCAYFNFCWC